MLTSSLKGSTQHAHFPLVIDQLSAGAGIWGLLSFGFVTQNRDHDGVHFKPSNLPGTAPILV